MIHLLNASTHAFLIQAPAGPEPTSLMFKRAMTRLGLTDGRIVEDWSDFDRWYWDKRKPRTADVPELQWIAKHAPKAELIYDRVVEDQAMFVVKFQDANTALLFKLTFGGADGQEAVAA